MNQQYLIFLLNKRKIQSLSFQKPQKVKSYNNGTYIAVCFSRNGVSLACIFLFKKHLIFIAWYIIVNMGNCPTSPRL